MNLNIYLKKIFIIVSCFCVFNTISYGTLIIGNDMRSEAISKLDINIATKGEMLKNGISGSYVDRIEEYRMIVGGFSKLDELKRISGIGEKTYIKIEKKFCIKTDYSKKRIAINIVDDKTLKYFGFLPKEIKALRKKLDMGEYINNNLELKEFVKTEKRYVELRDIVDYRKK